MKIIDINSIEEFNKQITSNNYCFVDFYATWCGPCRMLSPIIEELSSTYKDIAFLKINVDNNSNIASQYEVRSIPHVYLFKNKKPVASFVGYLPKEKIIEFIKENK